MFPGVPGSCETLKSKNLSWSFELLVSFYIFPFKIFRPSSSYMQEFVLDLPALSLHTAQQSEGGNDPESHLDFL